VEQTPLVYEHPLVAVMQSLYLMQQDLQKQVHGGGGWGKGARRWMRPVG
jgi:hypothetical protein